MRTVRVEYGRVQEVFGGDKVALSDKLHPDLLASMVEVTDAVPVSVGDNWDGVSFTPPVTSTPTPSNRPLTDRQLRIGLLSAGYDLALIEASIEATPNPIDRAIARVWWDRTTVIQWDHPMTQTLMGLAGIPENERTSLWMWASDIAA